MGNSYQGSCFCGSVQIDAKGDPGGMGYCHCEDCRSWAAAPLHTFSVWPPENVTVTKGEDLLREYSKSDFSTRKFCAKCGGHVFVYHPTLNLTDIPMSNIPDLTFEPQMHVNYASTVLPITDGLPKFKDFPVEFGGSGEMA